MHLPWPTDDLPAAACPAGLYVVATPIGNLEDITLRALRTLAGVDLIAAEDTRHTARLLSHFGIHTPLVSCHEHNEAQRVTELIAKIRAGTAVALVSDAGTPMLSDPGYRLVTAAVDQGLAVIPVPGVSAAITALSAAGLATDSFVFVGFAPKKKGRRMAWLEALAADPRTLVFYESPRRMVAFLEDLEKVMGPRQAVLARELTKLHEEFVRGTLSELVSSLAGRTGVKGECTLLVAGAAPDAPVGADVLEETLKALLAEPGARLSAVTRDVATRLGLPRKQVYAMALAIQGQTDDEA
jgi:16S rRNA (cytidine1402-2'-O)-methyltransferase